MKKAQVGKSVNKDEKPEWLDRVKKTYYFHINQLKDNRKHTIADTAKLLKRAIGPVSEELKVASWLRTHESQLFKFEYIKDAIEWIRSQKHKHIYEENDLD